MDTNKADTQHVVFVGGHSRIARLATPLLIDAGHQVHNVVRAPAQTADIQRLGGTSVLMDVEEASPSDFLAAFDGADVVVFSATVDESAAEVSINAAQQAGVTRYILVSSGAQPEAETHLRDSGLTYTILRPGELTDGDVTGRVTLTDDEPAEGTSRNNVAAVIGHIVNTGAAANQTVAFVDGDVPLAEALT
jgi:uncharacterized protein YbjT (DUF2867 family)